MEQNLTIDISEINSKPDSNPKSNPKTKKSENIELELDISVKEKIARFDEFVLTNWRKNKNISDFSISAYIIENNVLPYECKKCKQGNLWNNKPLNLILDRINNKVTDNRIDNIRFLCPNCYSQFRKKYSLLHKVTKSSTRNCIDCGKTIKNKTTTYNNSKAIRYRCKSCLEKSVCMFDKNYIDYT